MSNYLGRGIDQIDNISTLDNLSFNGSLQTFNLTQNSVAFVPVSADALQIQIDGVIQSGNYTVSGSTVTFDFTPDSGSVCNSVKHFGVGLLTTVSDGAVTTAKLGADAVTTAKINDGAVTSGKIASGVIPSTRPNAQALIINGNMDVWQRGTGTVTTTGGYVGVDRFKISEDTDGSYSTQRHTMSNAEFNTTGFGYALQADCTGTDASIGATQSAEITQKIEAQNLQLLQYGTSNAKSITLSFWVKSSKTGTYCIAINKKDSTAYNIAHEYTISSADTWEKKVIHISPTAGSTSFITSSAGAIANDNGVGLFVVFALAIGSNYHGANNTWTASSSLSTSNQVNWMDSTSNNFYLTGVQLEVGEYTSSTLPPFQHESFGDNLARCQRYFQMRAEGNQKIISIAHWGSSNEVDFIMQIPFMRTRPSVEYTTGNEYWAIGGGGSTNTLDNLNMNSWSTEMNINLWTTTGAGGTTGFAYYGYSNNASAKLGFTAEL